MWERPTWRELLALPYFDLLQSGNRGFLHYCGSDRFGRGVYVAGSGAMAPLVVRAGIAAAEVAGMDVDSCLFVDCASSLGNLSLACSRLWQLLRGPKGRRVFLARTALWFYPRLVDLVRAARFHGLQ